MGFDDRARARPGVADPVPIGKSSGHFSFLSDHDCRTSRAFLQRFRLVTLGLAAGFKISWDFENPKSGQTVIYRNARKRDESSPRERKCVS
ncbi:MAG: hypothetical protein DMF47_08490 [Verrucomicrobia bacterium]|nr:MAG: hypothetical protein DMF47_08490 [Verrucomicrobiota bacterium]PYL86292.1 MAG: hypothetical protein DMF17_06315 [Verrucomicrobiota bacterium]